MTVTTRNSEEKSQKRGTEKKTERKKYGTKKSRHGETRSGERKLYEFVAKARAYRRRSRFGLVVGIAPLSDEGGGEGECYEGGPLSQAPRCRRGRPARGDPNQS